MWQLRLHSKPYKYLRSNSGNLYLISFAGYQSYGRSSPFSTVSDMTFNLARQIGMEQCGQMAICDAHARYSDYGLLALPLILLFPG